MSPARSGSGLAGGVSGAHVSVALCTYNGAEFIEEQLESILAQSVLPRQIVVSDDGSTDDTVAMVRRILAPARLKKRGITVDILTRRQGLGVTKNFEAAMAACTEDFVILSDQDDIWHGDRVARLLEAFVAPEVLLAHSDARLVDASGEPLRHTLIESLGASRGEMRAEQDDRGFVTLLRRNLVTGATAMVRRSHVQAVMPFEPEWVHDHWLAITSTLRGRVAYLNDSLIDYRQHGANQIGVAKLTPGRAVTLLGLSRRERHAERVARIESLARRMDDGSIPATSEQRALVAAKLAHEILRRDLPDSRAGRIGPVLGECLRGRYARLSRGLIDVARDLFSPA